MTLTLSDEQIRALDRVGQTTIMLTVGERVLEHRTAALWFGHRGNGAPVLALSTEEVPGFLFERLDAWGIGTGDVVCARRSNTLEPARALRVTRIEIDRNPKTADWRIALDCTRL